jgi:hypothetical protein
MTSFSTDIVPLFRQKDINCMNGQGVELTSYTYMSDPTGDATYPDHANARRVLARLRGDEKPRMPMGGPFWTDDALNTYQSWLDGGFLA